MNSNEQAKKGFKTFLLTFGISALVLGVFYYLVSDAATPKISIEDASAGLGTTKSNNRKIANSAKEDLLGISDSEVDVATSVSGTPPELVASAVTDSQDPRVGSVFGDLSSQEVNVAQRTVLSGADIAQQSTVPVPDTGDVSMTFAIVASLAMLSFFVYILALSPRKYALSKFENEVLEDSK